MKEPFLKFVPDSWDTGRCARMMRKLAEEGYQYNGAIGSFGGEYWLFAPIETSAK